MNISKFFIIIIIVSTLSSQLVFSAIEPSIDDLNKALDQAEGSFTGKVDADGAQLDNKNGVASAQLTPNSEVSVSNGNLQGDMDKVKTTSGSEGSGVKGGKVTTQGHLSAQEASQITPPPSKTEEPITIQNVKGYEEDDTGFTAESGSSYQQGKTYLGNFVNLRYKYDDQTAEFDRAQSAKVFNNPFSALEHSIVKKTYLETDQVDSILLNNGLIAFKKLGPTKIHLNPDGTLKSIETTSNIDNNDFTFITPSTGTITVTANKTKKFKLEFADPKTLLTMNSEITGNINQNLYFNTLVDGAVMNSWKIGRHYNVEVSKSNLKLLNPNFIEKLYTRGTSYTTYTDEYGFEILELSDESEYVYQDKRNNKRDFLIQFLEEAKVKLRKTVIEEDFEENLIDLVNNKIVLNGKITYMRLVNDIFQKVFTTDNTNSIVEILLDPENINIKEFRIVSTDFEPPLTSYLGPFTVKEESHRYLYLRDLLTPRHNYFQRYISLTAPEIVILDQTLKQRNSNIFAVDNPGITLLLKSLSTSRYKNHLK